ncbi:MAG: hypothetical protein FD126_1329, partial [Elusimicrobia bacterium]
MSPLFLVVTVLAGTLGAAEPAKTPAAPKKAAAKAAPPKAAPAKAAVPKPA